MAIDNNIIFTRHMEDDQGSYWETDTASREGYSVRYFIRFSEREWVVTTNPYFGEPSTDGMMASYATQTDAAKVCSKYNESPDEYLANRRTCVECGRTFGVSKAEADWFESRGYAIPKRCRKCRNAKRKPNTKNADSTKDSAEEEADE